VKPVSQLLPCCDGVTFAAAKCCSSPSCSMQVAWEGGQSGCETRDQGRAGKASSANSFYFVFPALLCLLTCFVFQA